MTRHSRKHSASGVYHIMLRGINRQDIFEDEEDYITFISKLKNLTEPVKGSKRDGSEIIRSGDIL